MEKEKKNDLKSTDKVYDSVFWTGINKFTRYVPMLVNEAFGEHFTMNAEVEILPGKQVIDINEGKRLTRLLNCWSWKMGQKCLSRNPRLCF